jgi:hypothetical protein
LNNLGKLFSDRRFDVKRIIDWGINYQEWGRRVIPHDDTHITGRHLAVGKGKTARQAFRNMMASIPSEFWKGATKPTFHDLEWGCSKRNQDLRHPLEQAPLLYKPIKKLLKESWSCAVTLSYVLSETETMEEFRKRVGLPPF